MNNELQYFERKIKNLKFKIKKEKDVLQKTDLETEFYEELLKKAKFENDAQKVIEYAKAYHQKKIEYIDLIEGQKEIKLINLKEFLQKEFKDEEYVRSYIRVIDDNLKGIPVGVMVQFAASSYVGKTTTLMRLALNIAKTEKIVHFNFEMSDRILHKIYKDMITDYIEPKQLENLIIPQDTSNFLDDLVDDIKYLYLHDKIRFFIIDSRMKITTNDRTATEAATNISKKLSELVKKFGMTIILINQLSEEAIRENRLVLKESNNQEYDADLFFGLAYVYETEEINGKKKIKKDMTGNPIVKENVRLFKCKKNRLGKPFDGLIYINEIFPSEVKEVELTETKIDMPEI